MNKTVRNILLIMAIIIVILAIVWLGYDMLKKEPVNANVANTNLVDGNTGLDNIINDLFENVETNEQSTNTISDKEDNNIVENKEENTSDSTEKEASSSSTETLTSKEAKAIELVQEEWGDSDGVYFTNESIDSKGRYIVSVRDKQKTNSLAFYVVDVKTGLVTKQ